MFLTSSSTSFRDTWTTIVGFRQESVDRDVLANDNSFQRWIEMSETNEQGNADHFHETMSTQFENDPEAMLTEDLRDMTRTYFSALSVRKKNLYHIHMRRKICKESRFVAIKNFSRRRGFWHVPVVSHDDERRRRRIYCPNTKQCK